MTNVEGRKPEGAPDRFPHDCSSFNLHRVFIAVHGQTAPSLTVAPAVGLAGEVFGTPP
jgi:hypothetical protein